ncbi:GNAT family N-acetyltransferase [Sphingomonas sp. RIT328]|uniref:GNAT family N-acetyltransferase n=1 Tax=Sphingomonas sp. RIT328 TaxID=1470591 RepID=UPI00044F2604|nr:GNAT family N-acetyltransferase [Sphingomonas sp. RIT328]EZP49241.1 Acetyltransferase family protein [Sphingomonas sp. RIT328]
MTPPQLTTDRLTLHVHRPQDWAELAAMWADPAVYMRIGGVARPPEDVWLRLLRSIGQWQAFGYGSWVVRTHDGAFVGEAGLLESRRAIEPPLAWPEAGWTLAPAQHGRGYAQEAMTAALDWAAAHGAPRTTCIIDPANAPSLRLAAKLGYEAVREASYHGRTVQVLERGVRD